AAPEARRPLAQFDLRSRVRSVSFYPETAADNLLFGTAATRQKDPGLIADALICSTDDGITRVWALDRLGEDSDWEKQALARPVDPLPYDDLKARFDSLRAWKYAGQSDGDLERELAGWIKNGK